MTREELAQFVNNRYELLGFINDASHLIWIVLIVGIVSTFYVKKGWIRLIIGCILLGSLVFVYARYLERYWIRETYIDLERGWGNKIVLIADQHLGVYKGGDFMTDVVDRVNQIDDVDFIVIAGDFTYWPLDLEIEHTPLSKLRFPTYAVLGNHDVNQSGHITYEKELKQLLTKLGIQVLHNDIVKQSGVTIYGLGNNWSHTDDVMLLDQSDPKNENILVLTHNPDTTQRDYPDVDLSKSVTVTGHTHCGQIRIPWLYKYAIPTQGHFPDQGPYDLGKKGTLLITCGLGEVGLPLRLFNRPEIMVINL